MNYNEEMKALFEEHGLQMNVRHLRPDEKATPEDWANLSNRIMLKVHENEVMLAQSELNAARSALC